jgi:hypothetical protein
VSHSCRISVCALLLVAALPLGVRGQDEKPPPPPSQGRADLNVATAPPERGPVTFLPPEAGVPPNAFANGPITMRLDPCTHFPPEGPPISLFSPFELYARTGAALNTGRGPLSGILRTGVGVDGGLRSFCFDDDHVAAWYGDLGLSYLYNNSSDASESLITSNEQVAVNRLGQVIGLPATTRLGIRELHRASARLTFGREYYFASSWFGGVKSSLGGDLGGVWGWAHVKTQINSQTIVGSQPGDVVQGNSDFNHHGDQIKGFFLGGSYNLILPRHNYDFIIGTRVEWERDYFKLADNDDGASQMKFYLELGWRF